MQFSVSEDEGGWWSEQEPAGGLGLARSYRTITWRFFWSTAALPHKVEPLFEDGRSRPAQRLPFLHGRTVFYLLMELLWRQPGWVCWRASQNMFAALSLVHTSPPVRPNVCKSGISWTANKKPRLCWCQERQAQSIIKVLLLSHRERQTFLFSPLASFRFVRRIGARRPEFCRRGLEGGSEAARLPISCSLRGSKQSGGSPVNGLSLPEGVVLKIHSEGPFLAWSLAQFPSVTVVWVKVRRRDLKVQFDVSVLHLSLSGLQSPPFWRTAVLFYEGGKLQPAAPLHLAAFPPLILKSSWGRFVQSPLSSRPLRPRPATVLPLMSWLYWRIHFCSLVLTDSPSFPDSSESTAGLEGRDGFILLKIYQEMLLFYLNNREIAAGVRIWSEKSIQGSGS